MNDTHQTRWHHDLHPAVDVVPDSQHNALPAPLRPFFHPTHAALAHSDGRIRHWSSRQHRKGRDRATTPTASNRAATSPSSGLAHMGRIEYWNISWWVAMAFTTGSIVWVINGFAAFLPLISSRFAPSLVSTGWTAWVGATIFEAGSILGIWEAWNRGDTADFGWSVRRAFSVHTEEELKTKPAQRWIWFTTDSKYWHELGFLAAFAQLCAATIFWISGFTALPTIQEALLPHQGREDALFWAPQIVGGTGFIISALLLILETQHAWYLPNPLSLGWQIGFWNLVGAIGFTLCGALGLAPGNSGALYESSLSTFWGGWAFLIGSVIQWYESVNAVA